MEIFRDPTKPFAPDAWTTRRSRDIFCYIATSKHRRVAKDVLIDTFWPEEDPAVIEKNFHPTISHIRKALNSRQPFKQNFIVFRDGAYQLNPELSFLMDAEEFQLLVEAGTTRRPALRRDIVAPPRSDIPDPLSEPEVDPPVLPFREMDEYDAAP